MCRAVRHIERRGRSCNSPWLSIVPASSRLHNKSPTAQPPLTRSDGTVSRLLFWRAPQIVGKQAANFWRRAKNWGFNVHQTLTDDKSMNDKLDNNVFTQFRNVAVFSIAWWCHCFEVRKKSSMSLEKFWRHLMNICVVIYLFIWSNLFIYFTRKTCKSVQVKTSSNTSQQSYKHKSEKHQLLSDHRA